MRTLILGAGATGGYFGARMIEGGADVTFLVRPRRAELLRSNGLVVKSTFGDLELADVQVLEQANEPYDLIILSCKAYDLDSSIATIRPAVGATSTVLPLLNGMRHIDQLQAQFGQDKIIGGLCVISSKLDEDGTIMHYNDAHGLKFGELSGKISPRIEQIKEVMQPTKIDWRASEKIEQDMWEKWAMLGSLASLTCLMRATIGQIARSPGGTEIAKQTFDECVSVLDACGFSPDAKFIESVGARSTDPNSKLTASMLRDVERGGSVEADHIIGDLIARGEAKNLKLPMLKVAYCHLKAYEARKADGN